MSCVKNTTKKYTTRPGPPYPAQLCQDQIKKGNDGLIYKSTANSKGIFQWKKVSTKSAKVSTKSAKVSTKSAKVSAKSTKVSTKSAKVSGKFAKSKIMEDPEREELESKGYRYIFNSELYTMTKNDLLGMKYLYTNSIIVTPKFYKELKKAPKKISNFIDPAHPEPLNAYIFGKRYPSETYQYEIGHGNDGSQTGLLDLTMWRKNPVDLGGTAELRKWWSKTFKPYKWNWDNRDALKKVQSVYPSILFLGDTLGDGGANLFIHRDSRDEIDSIAIVY
jgi:hypothetical protein